MIKVKNLHKSFGKLEVLCGIDEHIQKGEKVVVIGPSGSGKSTFLRCLNLLETPTKGEIYIDDELINTPKADVNKIREKMGMVFQQFNLFPHLSIMDNIILAPMKGQKNVESGRFRQSKRPFEKSRSFGKSGCFSRTALGRTAAENCNCPRTCDGSGDNAFRQAYLRS